MLPIVHQPRKDGGTARRADRQASPDEDTDGETSCTYPPADAGSWAQAEITIEWTHGDEPSFERLLADALGGSAVGRRVAHDVRLGDADRHVFVGHRRLCRADLRDSFFYRTETAAAAPPVVTPASMFSLSTRSRQEFSG
jgi:hypothetical protein